MEESAENERIMLATVFYHKGKCSLNDKNAPRGPHRPGDGGTGRTGTE